jgi:hypothetical protein
VGAYSTSASSWAHPDPAMCRSSRCFPALQTQPEPELPVGTGSKVTQSGLYERRRRWLFEDEPSAERCPPSHGGWRVERDEEGFDGTARSARYAGQCNRPGGRHTTRYWGSARTRDRTHPFETEGEGLGMGAVMAQVPYTRWLRDGRRQLRQLRRFLQVRPLWRFTRSRLRWQRPPRRLRQRHTGA